MFFFIIFLLWIIFLYKIYISSTTRKYVVKWKIIAWNRYFKQYKMMSFNELVCKKETALVCLQFAIENRIIILLFNWKKISSTWNTLMFICKIFHITYACGSKERCLVFCLLYIIFSQASFNQYYIEKKNYMDVCETGIWNTTKSIFYRSWKYLPLLFSHKT